MTKIILIGGPQRCGKTTLAQKISKQLNISWIGTDVLGAVAREYTPRDQDDILFPKSAIRRITKGSNDVMYEDYSAEQIIESYIIQGETISKAIKALISYASSEGYDYIIEGYAITPKLISDIKRDGFEVDSVILVNTNKDEIVQRCISSDVQKDWVRDQTKNKETYLKIAAMIESYSLKFIVEAKRFNIRVVDLGEDFQKRFEEVCESFVNN